jgi:SAM-dependent methyltransferase
MRRFLGAHFNQIVMFKSQPMKTPVAEWRQPRPLPAVSQTGKALAPGSLRGRLSGGLAGVFEASEDENRRVILDLVRAGPQRRRVVDLGCFNGAFTLELGHSAQAERLVGVEWLEEHAAIARSRGVEVVESDLNEALPFEDASFDLVHANQLIEHLRSTDLFLREARRICAPGGRIVISTNNLASWHNIGALLFGLQPLPSHVSDEVHVGNPFDPRRGRRHADVGQTHLRVFTTRALRELAAAHGLRVTASRANGYYPLPPALARAAARIDPLHAAFIVLELAHADAPAAL